MDKCKPKRLLVSRHSVNAGRKATYPRYRNPRSNNSCLASIWSYIEYMILVSADSVYHTVYTRTWNTGPKVLDRSKKCGRGTWNIASTSKRRCRSKRYSGGTNRTTRIATESSSDVHYWTIRKNVSSDRASKLSPNSREETSWDRIVDNLPGKHKIA